jgi:tetratricopeptide (TPR) repeat protein
MIMQQTAAFYFERANTRFRDGEVDSAYADLDTAINLEPDNWEYRYIRAQLRDEAEQYELAVEDYSVMVTMNADLDKLEQIHHRRAVVYEKLGLYERLLEDLTWLINHGAGDSLLYAWRGYHHYRLGHHQESLADYLRAHDLAPENNGIALQLARSRYQVGQYNTVINEMTALLEQVQEHPSLLSSAHYWRGESYLRLGHSDQAEQDFAESRRLNGLVDKVDNIR